MGKLCLKQANEENENWNSCTVAASPAALWAVATAAVRRLRLNRQIPELQVSIQKQRNSLAYRQ